MSHLSRRIECALRRCVARMVGLGVLMCSALWMGPVWASGAGVPLDRFPVAKLSDQAALQHGAKLFVNYCLGCHSANLMRYNRLEDIGLSAEQIRGSLMFTGTKVGDPMRIAMAPADAKAWFGAWPPDLSVTARARASHDGSGADWLYSYLRSYYRDASRATGWNNAVFPNVGMPHVFWGLQGARGATFEEVKAEHAEGGGKVYRKTTVRFDEQGTRSESSELLEGGHHHEGVSVKLGEPQGGALSAAQYDDHVADLVAFLTFMSDPSAKARVRIGVWVLMFLLVFTGLAWWLNREFWKDVA
jgi:ubiquinol-cytochrome c reductase cytochrome c1 subunit